MTENAASDAVAEALKKLNRAWLSEQFDELPALLHRDVVAVAPGFVERSRGSEAFIAGLRDFVQSATIHDFAEHDIEADVIGDSAVASYRFEIDFERSGQRYLGTGRDLYVFRRVEGEWLAVWRTLLGVDERPL
jgi:ketosteroid isomerase-like protein